MRGARSDGDRRNRAGALQAAVVAGPLRTCLATAALLRGAAVAAEPGLRRGVRFAGPSLWLYSRNDPFYSLKRSRKSHKACVKAGGQGRFLDSRVPSGHGHFLTAQPDLWQDELAAFMDSLER